MHANLHRMKGNTPAVNPALCDRSTPLQNLKQGIYSTTTKTLALAPIRNLNTPQPPRTIFRQIPTQTLTFAAMHVIPLNIPCASIAAPPIALNATAPWSARGRSALAVRGNPPMHTPLLH